MSQFALHEKMISAQSISTLPVLANSEIIGTFNLTTKEITARVHCEYEPKYSKIIATKFKELNKSQQSKGMVGYYTRKGYRIITFPKIESNALALDLAPLNYAFVALLKDEETSTATKRQIQNKIREAIRKVPKRLISNDLYFNAHSYNLLGILVCLITSDGKILLRKRGRSVLTARNRWDVSIGGHVQSEDAANNKLDLVRTVQREAQCEIGNIVGDPGKIVFTGLHRNREYGDIDIFALWPVKNTAAEIRELISDNRNSNQQKKRFITTKKAPESYVWDSENLLVEFNGPRILGTLQSHHIDLASFAPESLVCLDIVLKTKGKPGLI